ncbi:hypothetical protein Gasu2_27210 [Galdieria sulphuraria]|nr:hypothetical protein Gasu2_27210 [Galdieria sulphuraria]
MSWNSSVIASQTFCYFLDQLTKACLDLSTRKAEELHQTLEKALQSIHKSSTLEFKVWLELCVSSLVRILENHPERCTDNLAFVLAPKPADEVIPSFCFSFKSQLSAQATGSIYYSFVQLLESYERQHLATNTRKLDSGSTLSAIAAERMFWLSPSVSESIVLEAADSSHLKHRNSSEKIPWDAISTYAEEGEEDMLYYLLYQLKSEDNFDDTLSLNVADELLLGFCVTEFSSTFSHVLHRIYHENKKFWLNLDQVIHLPSVVQRVAYQSFSCDSFELIKQRLVQVHAALLNETSVTIDTAIEYLNSDISFPLYSSFLEALKDRKILEAVPVDTLYIIMYHSHELIMKTENATLLFRLSMTYSCILLFMEA